MASRIYKDQWANWQVKRVCPYCKISLLLIDNKIIKNQQTKLDGSLYRLTKSSKYKQKKFQFAKILPCGIHLPQVS